MAFGASIIYDADRSIALAMPSMTDLSVPAVSSPVSAGEADADLELRLAAREMMTAIAAEPVSDRLRDLAEKLAAAIERRTVETGSATPGRAG